MGEGLKQAKKAAKATRQPIAGHPDYRLSISFDSSKLRGEFVAWLEEEAGSMFASMIASDRGSDIDIDYDSSSLVVVHEHQR